MKIYLIRHGQSTHNANDDTPHNPDPPLTRIGRQQAERTAAALRAENLGAVALYASPMRRALETAAFLQAGLEVPTHIVPDLCEAGGLHAHTGLCRAEILREWPEVTLDERIKAEGWWTLGTTEDKEEAVYRRAAQGAALLRERHRADGHTIVVVTHGRFGSVLISTLLEMEPVGYSRFSFHNCGISRVDYDLHADVAAYPPPARLTARPGEALEAVRLRFHNRTTHLPPQLLT